MTSLKVLTRCRSKSFGCLDKKCARFIKFLRLRGCSMSVYKTFFFRPLEGRLLAFKGKLTNSDGKPLAGKAVTVVEKGVVYRTFTNAKGEYRFFGDISGPLKLRVDGLTWKLSQVSADESIDLVAADSR